MITLFVFQLFQGLPSCKGSKTDLDSGFHAVDSGFLVLDSGLCQWNLDPGFYYLVGFRIGLELYSGIQSPVFWIPQGKFPSFRIPQ